MVKKLVLKKLLRAATLLTPRQTVINLEISDSVVLYPNLCKFHLFPRSPKNYQLSLTIELKSFLQMSYGISCDGKMTYG